ELEKSTRLKEAIKRQKETKQRQEALVQQKIRDMGVCEQGYAWIKEEGGYRCAGGSHFLSNSEIGI
ncbi:hypothetical protein GLOTRDRAFT_7992, partial [Gloeophyllum trabeum ATCC 11539]